jgi:hypothetical protein
MIEPACLPTARMFRDLSALVGRYQSQGRFGACGGMGQWRIATFSPARRAVREIALLLASNYLSHRWLHYIEAPGLIGKTREAALLVVFH